MVLPAVAVAVAIAALWWTLLDRIAHEERFLEETTRQNTAVMAQMVEEHAVATFRRLDDLLTDVATRADRDIPPQVRARRSFEEGLAASIRIYDRNGQPTLTIGRALDRDSIADRDEFLLPLQVTRETAPAVGDSNDSPATRNIRNGWRAIVIGTPFVYVETGETFIPVSRRLTDAEGRFRGVAVIDVPTVTFARFYAKLNLPPGSSVALLRSDGPVLARQALQDRVVGRIFRSSSLWGALAEAPIGHYRAVSPVDGTERLYAYRIAGDYPLVTVVGESVETVFTPWWQNRAVSLGWATATTAVILLFTSAFLVELRRRRSGDRALRIRNRAMASSGDGILIADATRPDMPVVYANPAFERLMGLPADAIIDRAVLGILEGPMHQPALFQPLREAIGGATDMRVEFQRPLRPGEADGLLDPDARATPWPAPWLELRASPVRDEAGQLVSLIAIVRDVSEHKRSQAALAEARREAERANIAKSKFLAAASHDLRQPVQSLMLLMEVLSARATDEPTRKVVGTMDRALGALKMLLDGLLDVSRLDAGAVEAARGVFPVAELLDRVAVASRPVAVRKGLLLHIMPCSAYVDSDPLLLGRILQNLVENALRYTERGQILVGCRRRGATLRIEVWDTGIGIPADRQDDIFQEFVQVGNAGRDRGQGLGLGLAVVRRLAQMLGHRVTLRSVPQRGSVFAVEVPLALTPPVVAAPAAELPARIKDSRGAIILVVEDDPIVREGLRAMLHEWGYRVRVAASCAEALALLCDGPAPNAIVADYRLLDGHTGTETIREVRRVIGRAVPAILVTGDTAPERLAEAEAGDFRVMHKPVIAHELHRAIAGALDAEWAEAEGEGAQSVLG